MQILGNRFLAERVKSTTTTTAGGIYLPPIVLDDNNTGGPKEWLVLQVGPGRKYGDVLVPLEFGPGDRVLAHSYTTGAKEYKDGKFILEAEAVIAVVPKV